MTNRPPEPTPANLVAQQLAIGRQFLATGAYDKAAQRFRAALEINPEHVTAHCDLARALERQQQVKEALQEVDIALQLKPEHAHAFYLKGTFLATQKRFKEGEALVRRAIELSSPHAPYFVMLGSIIYRANRVKWRSTRRYREAEEVTRRALELDPESVSAHRVLGIILMTLNRQEEAWQHYAKALQLDPEDAVTHSNVGMAVLHYGDVEQALQHLAESLRQNPEDKNLQRQFKAARQHAAFMRWRHWLWNLGFGRLPRLARIPVAVLGFFIVIWLQDKIQASSLKEWWPYREIANWLLLVYCVLLGQCGHWLRHPPSTIPLAWGDALPNADTDSL